MPAKTPLHQPKLKQHLNALGKAIRSRRKELKVSAVATSEAAGISRMTLNRIEKGESSVTIGAYLKVLSVLGLSLKVMDLNQNMPSNKLSLSDKVTVDDYPQLKNLAWQLKNTTKLSPKEALDIYERNWRHLDLKKMKPEEWALIQELLTLLGRKKPLV